MPIGRYAPSPTGRLHIGNLRTALLAWLYARCDQSKFWLRFEDLDTEAVRSEHYRTQVDDLRALGLDWDEPVWNQSERIEHYHDALDRLRADDLIYPCYCSRREIREAASAPNSAYGGHHYPGTCTQLNSAQRAERELTRPPAFRIRAQGHIRSINDEIVGEAELVLDDFVLQRNDGTPAYHLAVVVDDAASGIELVVRGDDLVESACRQLFVYESLGLEKPAGYAHAPLVLAPDGNRLAKRHGAVSLADRESKGETPAQVLSLLASSLGLCAEGEAVTAESLLATFDREAFGAKGQQEPTTLGPDYLATPAD